MVSIYAFEICESSFNVAVTLKGSGQRVEILRELEGERCKFKIKDEIVFFDEQPFGALYEGVMIDEES